MRDEEIQQTFEAAAGLRKAGDFAAALPLFESIYVESPTFAVCLLLGDVLDELGEHERGAKLFRQAIALHPESEPASVLLFHLLLRNGLRDEALNEMHRYTESYAPNWYIDLQRLFDEGRL